MSLFHLQVLQQPPSPSPSPPSVLPPAPFPSPSPSPSASPAPAASPAPLPSPGPLPIQQSTSTGAPSSPVAFQPGQAVGFFTDSTLCIGCKACEVACKQWNQLPANDGGAGTLTGNSYDNTGQ